MITINRKTKETEIALSLDVNAARNGGDKSDSKIDTGLPFFDHMLDQLASHAGWCLQLSMKADTEVDDHHGIEDAAICLGEAFYQAWKENSPNARYGQRLLPMDEALTLCAVDLCGRAYCITDLPFTQSTVGGIYTEMWTHFFYSFAVNAKITLHIKNMYFSNNHHLVEGAFKALAYALKEALQPTASEATTKGVL